jgi:hypothetical protein
MPNSSKLGYSVALLVASGLIWVIAGVAFGSLIAVSYLSNGSLTLAGVHAGYPVDAKRQLVWDQFYINLYTAVIGLFVIIIGLTAFKRGDKWAWYAMLVFVLNGLITSIFDYLSWGGWYTIFSTLPAILALLLSVRDFFELNVKH